jgi:hypothetical protein
MNDYTTPCTVAHPHMRVDYAYVCAVCSKRIDPVDKDLSRFDLAPCDGESGECHAEMVKQPDGDWLEAAAVYTRLEWFDKRCSWYQQQLDVQRETTKRFFDDQIATAMKARKLYQDGAAEREGIQRESYLAYADAQATRETFLREIFAALSFKENP